jgi:hypothetical protein
VTTMTWPRTESTSVAQTIARMDAGRLRAYRENLEFYQGRQWLDPVRRRERRLTLNYARTVIEKTASCAFVASPLQEVPRWRFDWRRVKGKQEPAFANRGTAVYGGLRGQ